MTTVQVFLGSGSMSLNKAYADIELRAQTEMTPKDIADAVVLEYRASELNKKLGTFNDATDTHSNDSMSFPVAELHAELTAGNGAAGVNTGALSGKLTAFKDAVLAIFASGSETLFDEETFSGLDHSFGGSQMMALMAASSINAGEAGNNLSLANINAVLRDAVDKKHNRADVDGNVVANTSNGFVKDDRIFFVDGVSLTIQVAFADAQDPDSTSQEGLSVNHQANLVLQVV